MVGILQLIDDSSAAARGWDELNRRQAAAK
jgi:hypothetical protein